MQGFQVYVARIKIECIHLPRAFVNVGPCQGHGEVLQRSAGMLMFPKSLMSMRGEVRGWRWDIKNSVVPV